MLRKCLKLNCNFNRGGGGGGVLRKNPFGSGGGMEILWNHTLCIVSDMICTIFGKLLKSSCSLKQSLNLILQYLSPFVTFIF